MKNQTMPSHFSSFSCGLATFCLPILLCPIALLLSPELVKNPTLGETERSLFTAFLVGYPFLLALWARLLYKLNQRNSALGIKALIISFVIFYVIAIYVCVRSFSI